jgi:TRAP-type mannitol/chloroaromatic compound transport system permease large subunit
MLIVYGATAGVSVVKLYAGAFFPGIMLAGLYVVYVIVLAKLRPDLMPPLTAAERHVPLTPTAQTLQDRISPKVLPGLVGALKGSRNAGVPFLEVMRQALIAALPAIFLAVLLTVMWRSATAPDVVADTAGLVEMGAGGSEAAPQGDGLAEPPGGEGEKVEGGLAEPPSEDAPKAADGVKEPAAAEAPASAGVPAAQPSGAATVPAPVAESATTPATEAAVAERKAAPLWFWIVAGVLSAVVVGYYAVLTFTRLEVFKMLLSSFFPLAFMILAVLGTIVFGLATPTEAAAVGSLGGVLLAGAYRQLNMSVVKESVFLTAKTSAMVCWLFVGSSIFSAAFALLGGQELIENWVMSLGLSKVQFLLLSQAIIFLLGWPLEWTEIIVIFMPIFIPLLDNFGVDPLFFGLLVALNLQTAFLSPPVAMAAFYLKGVAPPHVTLNQIFAGMIPFMLIQIIALALLYVFPEIGLWLPAVLYK